MFPSSWRAVRLGGVEVRLDPSWVLIVLLVGWSLLRRFGTDWAGLVLWAMAAAGTLGFFGSILAHELAHAFEAKYRGLRVHAITLFLFGGVTEMEPRRDRARDELAVAAIGPGMSLLLAAVFGGLAAGIDWYIPAWHAVAVVAGLLGWINLALALFNLVPGAPLDGGRVLRALLWGATRSRSRATQLAAGAGIMVAVGMFAAALWLFNNNDVTSAIWTGAIGVFLLRGAIFELRHANAEATAEATTDPPPKQTAPPSTSQHRGWIRRVGFTLATAIVAAGALAIPLPYIEIQPGPVLPMSQMMTVDHPTTPLSGDTGLLTIRQQQPSIVAWAAIQLDEARQIRPLEEFTGGDTHREELDRELERFNSQFQLAAGVGLAEAGHEVELRTVPRVRQVLDGTSSDGVLRVGDLIRRYRGQVVQSIDEVVALTDGVALGEPLALQIERHDELLELEIPAGPLPATDRLGLGVSLDQVLERAQLPFEVRVDQRGIGGPSGGLVTALTVYDLVSDEDLLAGRDVAATGTVDADGRVGRIGSVGLKVREAFAQGFDLVLVPADQLADARAAANGDIEVIGVATVREAITALQ